MTPRSDLQPVGHSIAVWQRYDSHVKADLWSTAVHTAAGVYIIDPIPVDQDSLAQFVGETAIAAVIVTNENHVRDAPSFCSAFGAPLFARFGVSLPAISTIRTDESLAGLTIIDLPGAPVGEISIIDSQGNLVVGDALINFEPYGFTFLPDKYCTEPEQLRRSLRALLDHDFHRLFFAHGTPITNNAHRRLESLLASAHGYK